MAAERDPRPAVQVRSRRHAPVRGDRLPFHIAAEVHALRAVLEEEDIAAPLDAEVEFVLAMREMREHAYGSRAHEKAEARVALAWDAMVDARAGAGAAGGEGGGNDE